VVDLKRREGKGDCERVCPESVFEVRRIEDEDTSGARRTPLSLLPTWRVARSHFWRFGLGVIRRIW
jgi:hypothetical protein